MKRDHKIILLLAGLVFLALAFSFLLTLNVSTIHAQEIANINPTTGQAEVFGINPEAIPQTPEDAKTVAKNYLLQEWKKILADGKVTGPIIKAYAKISPYTDPFFLRVLGIAPDLSWLFILAFWIWIDLLLFLYRILDFATLMFKFSSLTRFLAALALTIILSITIGLPKAFAALLLNLISLVTTWWIQLTAMVLLVAGLIVFSIFSDQIQIFVEAWKKKLGFDETTREVKSSTKKIDAFIRGTQQGTKLSEEINK